MENAYADGVIESISLCGEMLGCSPPSKAFKMCHCEIIGDLTKKESGEIVFGPIVICSLAYNTLMLSQFQNVPFRSLRLSARCLRPR